MAVTRPEFEALVVRWKMLHLDYAPVEYWMKRWDDNGRVDHSWLPELLMRAIDRKIHGPR